MSKNHLLKQGLFQIYENLNFKIKCFFSIFFYKKRYGAMRRDVAGVETAIKQIVDEAVESNP